VCERRGQFDVLTAERVLRATPSGRLFHELSNDDRLAVGDWVLVDPAEPVARIRAVLERQGVLRRVQVGGSSRAQTLAANVDLCFVVCALSRDDAGTHVAHRALNVRRIERYLLVAEQSRIAAAVVVNKADLAGAPEGELTALASELSGVEVLLTSAESGLGLDALRSRIGPGTTAVLLGSSGVGKSSLLNRLLGRALARTGDVREDDARGRHTTSERQLHLLPSGGLLIDTPGMRELALFADSNDELAGTGFAEIDELATGCRFGDCQHRDEPGCAVKAALDRGALSVARLEHARKLERERLHQLSRSDARLRKEARERNRTLSRFARAQSKAKRGD
jgi:ribosome biogenesis GTPase